jgi:hypothetical protein
MSHTHSLQAHGRGFQTQAQVNHPLRMLSNSLPSAVVSRSFAENLGSGEKRSGDFQRMPVWIGVPNKAFLTQY